MSYRKLTVKEKASIESQVHWVLLIIWWLVNTIIVGGRLATNAILTKEVVVRWGRRG